MTTDLSTSSSRTDIVDDVGAEVVLMSSVIVRGLDDAVKQRLVEQPKEHGRSKEAEVRDILTRAASRPHTTACACTIREGVA